MQNATLLRFKLWWFWKASSVVWKSRITMSEMMKYSHLKFFSSSHEATFIFLWGKPSEQATFVINKSKLVGTFRRTRCLRWCKIGKDSQWQLFFDEIVTGDAYLEMLRYEAFPNILSPEDDYPNWFQQVDFLRLRHDD